MDVDDKGGTDGGEQTRLQGQVRWLAGANDTWLTKGALSFSTSKGPESIGRAESVQAARQLSNSG